MKTEPKVAFQVLLPVSLLEATRRRCAELQIDSVGGFIRQLLAAELARTPESEPELTAEGARKLCELLNRPGKKVPKLSELLRRR